MGNRPPRSVVTLSWLARWRDLQAASLKWVSVRRSGGRTGSVARSRRGRVVGLGGITVVCCVGYVFAILDQGWIPHDEGQLGLTVQRILAGELPHRDFVEPYTGGLGYYHAIWCRGGGLSAGVIRLSLLPWFALYCGVLYWLSNRAASWPVAMLVTLLGTALTVPIYPAAMPSWFNLFFAVLGAAALLRYHETERTRWLVMAGLCGGFSITVKIVGFFFAAAAIAFLLYRALSRFAARPAEVRPASAFSFDLSPAVDKDSLGQADVADAEKVGDSAALPPVETGSGRLWWFPLPGNAFADFKVFRVAAATLLEFGAVRMADRRDEPCRGTPCRAEVDHQVKDTAGSGTRAQGRLDRYLKLSLGLMIGCLSLLFLTRLIRFESAGMDLFHFGLPLACLLILLGIPLLRSDSLACRYALYQTWCESQWFCLGLGLPLLLLILPYAWLGELHSLGVGVLVLPWQRLAQASLSFPNQGYVLAWSLPWVLVPCAGLFSPRGMRYLCALLIGMIGGQFAVSVGSSEQVLMLPALRQSLPLMILVTTMTALGMSVREPRLFRPHPSRAKGAYPRASLSFDVRMPQRGTGNFRTLASHDATAIHYEWFLWSTMTYAVSLVQFPYAGTFYFFYAAPMGVLLVLSLTRVQPRLVQRLTFVAGVLILAFLICRLHHPNPALAGKISNRWPPVAVLDLPRCRVWMRAGQAELYQRLVKIIHQHSRSGAAIYAGPDCPEVCFLAERSSCTRSCYGLFADEESDLGQGLKERLERDDVSIAVVNLYGEFTRELPASLLQVLNERFPYQRELHSTDQTAPQAFRIYTRTGERSP